MKCTRQRAIAISRIAPFAADLAGPLDEAQVDREALLAAFKAYLDANKLEADWESVERASNATLVNSMAMMSPYGPAEKQALLRRRTSRPAPKR